MLDSFFLITGYTLLAGLSLFSVWLTDRHKREHFVLVFMVACITIFCLALANRLTLAPAFLLIFLMLLAGNIHRVKLSTLRVLHWRYTQFLASTTTWLSIRRSSPVRPTP